MASRGFQRNKSRVKRLVGRILKYKPETVLDVGCGLGVLVRTLRKNGVETYGVDFADCLLQNFWKEPYFVIGDAKHLPFADKSFDLVFSSDFFEHLPHFEIGLVHKEMQRVAKKKILAEISCSKTDGNPHGHQLHYHLSNFPKSWWKEKLGGVVIF